MIPIRHLIGGATRGRLISKAACRPPRGVIDQGWLCPLVGESGIKQKRSITNNQGPLNSAAAAVSPIQGDEVRELQPGDFHDPKSIYQFKSFFELVKATFVFQLCKFNFIVDNSLKIMVVGEKLLGRRLFKFLSRPVIYDQFVGGENPRELAATVSDLNKSNLRLMACTGLEEDVGDIVASGTKYDRNAETLMTISDVLAVEGGTLPSLQLKMTAFMPAELLTKITTIFNNGEISMKDFVEEIHRKGGETDFPQLTPIENEALRLGMRRLYKIGFRAKESGVRLLVDAEYTYMNPGISVGALAMMLALNRDGQAVVANTYQCYLKDALNTLKQESDIILGNDCMFGAKIVRGAYMEKERLRASQQGYPDPVNDTYQDTCLLYDRVVKHMIENFIAASDVSSENGGYKSNGAFSEGHYLVVASHNQESLFNAIGVMRDNGLGKNCENVVFGQIYGMGEQISMPLANAGYLVYKSVPYGPLHELMPYLSRRAAESRAILQTGVRKEKELLAKEMKRRVASRN